MTLTFPDVTLPLQVEAAFGADLMGDPSIWSWADLSDRLLDDAIRIERGREPGSSELSAAGCTVVLDNQDGQLTPLHPVSQWYPWVDMGTPLRVSVTRNANHDFEDDADDWTATGGTIQRSSAQAHEGVASMLLTPDGVASTAIAVSGVVPVTPGREWIASGWVYSAAGYGSPAGVAVRLLDEAQAEVSLQQASSDALSAGTWTYQEAAVTIPLGVTYAQVAVTVTGSPTSGDVLYADEVRLRSVRFAGYANSWQPQFVPTSGGEFDSTVTLQANGIVRRLGQGSPVLRSALLRSTLRQPNLIGYWPLEDQPGASVLASAVAGVRPARIRGAADVQVGAGPVAPGSGPSVLLTAGVTSSGAIRCLVPTDAGPGWIAESCFRIEPDTPGGDIWTMMIGDSQGSLWEARAALSGQTLTISLRFTPGAEGGGSQTTLHSEAVARGTYHQVKVLAEQQTSDRHWQLFVDGVRVADVTASGATTPLVVGKARYVDLSAAEILVGHVAVYRYDADLAVSTWRAVEGWSAEKAPVRFLRICAEQGIDSTLPLQPSVIDTFERTVVDGWGDTETGETWILGGAASAFAVNSGAGSISDAPGVTVETATLPSLYSDADMHALVDVGANSSVGLIARAAIVASDLAFGYYFEIQPTPINQVTIWRLDVGFFNLVGTTPLQGTGPWHLRAQCVGPMLRCKVWLPGTPEPASWTLTVQDDEFALGDAGCAHFGTEPATFDDFRLTDLSVGEPMGPQPIATTLGVLSECETAERGLLYEDGFGLGFVPRVLRYNRDPALTVDLATYRYQDDAGEVLAPTRDDQGMTNTVQAERPDGSSAIVQDVAHAQRYLAYEDTELVNVESDQRLPDQASWRVHEGTVSELRQPTPLDLAANPDLIDLWLGVELGDRTTRTGLPAIYPPGDVERVLTGYSEVLGSRSWMVVADGEPYAPWIVGTYGDDAQTPGPDAPQRYDTAGAETVGSFDAGADTALTVATTQGRLWTVDPADLPFDVQVAGAVLRVTAIAGGSSPQTFTVDQQPVNGVEKSIPAESDVRLAHPAIYAL